MSKLQRGLRQRKLHEVTILYLQVAVATLLALAEASMLSILWLPAPQPSPPQSPRRVQRIPPVLITKIKQNKNKQLHQKN